MSLPRLTVIPAGAGSGKTYTLQQQLGRWVAEGKVAPERIVAVTFTEAAAAELKDRIGTQLLGMGRVEDALRVEEAYVSTIHGFGLRVLTEFAFESGRSPQPRLLNEHEQNALIRLALARTDRTDAITGNLAAFGYRFDFNSKRTPEDAFRDDVLRIIELLRSVGWQEYTEVHATQAATWIERRYGPLADPGPLGRALRESVAALLGRFPASLAGLYPDNRSATEALQRDFRNLRAAIDGDAVETDWELWQSLRELRLSKRNADLPRPYDELATAVISAASALPTHPGPLRHAQRHIETLLAAGQDVLVQYDAAKREAGLVDYGDMIALAGKLLRERTDVLGTLLGRVDCLVVDEFQDTNPLQFALIWQLTSAGVPTIVVGDLKQAIMGFQGADPRLFEALERQHPGACRPLTKNWRSQPRLMEFVNVLGPQLFGEAYTALVPQRERLEPVPLEAVSFTSRPRKDHHRVRALAVGRRLRALIDDPAQTIVDRRSRQSRPLEGRDIAVLCPTHDMLEQYAEVLRALGLEVRLQAEGWHESRAVQIVRYALAYLANPADRHAALYLAVTELGSLTLQPALIQLIETGRVTEPLLERLDALAEGVAERTVYALVADTISALRLFDRVACWPDGEQARANLLRLMAEAAEFMDANREALACGGFHGGGVQTFLAWLEARVELEDGDRQPEPRVLDEDAIVLSTWHSAKGREWPVVAVCGFDKIVGASLPDMALGYGSFEELSRLLELARIEYAPAFAAPETGDRFLAELEPRAQSEARRLLYVALTRARDKLVLEWPGYLSTSKTRSYWTILAHDCHVSLGKDTLAVGEAEFACAVTKGGSEWPEDFEPASGRRSGELPVFGRRAVQARAVPADLTPDSRTASGLALAPDATVEREVAGLDLVRYGGPLTVEIGLTGTALGSFLHRCFEVLGAKPALAERIGPITGVAVDDSAARALAEAVTRFEAWLMERLRPTSVEREWPLLAVDAAGSVVAGVADLIAHTPEGAWIIDHKSDVVEDPSAAFLRYAPQLDAYRHALEQAGCTVAGIAINWVRRGEVVMQATRRRQAVGA